MGNPASPYPVGISNSYLGQPMYTNLETHIASFVKLQPEELPLLRASLKTAELRKKELLFREGEVCRADYFVDKGCLRMFFIDDKGTERTTQFAIENWWMADYISLDRQTASGFSLQAVVASRVLLLERNASEKLLAAVPALERYFRIIRQRAYAASQVRMKYMYDFSGEEMYRHFSRTYPGFIQQVPQYMVASFLGMTPEYLSEIRKRTGQ